MARWGDFTFGSGTTWGHALPSGVDIRRIAWRALRIRDALTGELKPDPAIARSATVSQELGGRPSARIECDNPGGAHSALFAKGDLIRLEVALSAPGQPAVTADLGRYWLRRPELQRSTEDQSIGLDCVSEIEERLRYPVSGNLPVVAAAEARRWKLLAPDNTTASVPGIIAYLLIAGGITAVRLRGPVVLMQAFIELSGSDYIGPFNLTGQPTALRVLADLEEMGGVYTYVDPDGTGVIAALPRHVLDANREPPVRRWADSGPDAVSDDVRARGLEPVTQVQLTNQNASGTDRIAYALPEGQGIPRRASGLAQGVTARSRNVATYPPEVADPAAGQATRASQQTFDEALRAGESRLRVVADPGLWTGDSVRLAFPDDGTEGPHLLRRLSHAYRQGGKPRVEVVAQKLPEPVETVTGTVGTTSYSFGYRVLQCGIGGSGILRTGGAAVHSVDAFASLFLSGSFTLEGEFRFVSWPKDGGGNNIPLALLLSPSCDLVLSGGSGTTMTATATMYTAAGATALTGFNVTNNGDAWLHFRMVHNAAADTFRVWMGGILKASATGVTAAPAAQYRNVRVLSRLGVDVTASTPGRVAFAHVRYRSDAVVADGSNFTPPAAPFTDSAAPCVLHWPCRDLDGNGLVADYLYSTAGNVYGRRSKVRVGQPVSPYIFDSAPYSAGVAAPY